MGYLSNIKKQYLISFFHALIPAYVIERLFWQERGMDVEMVVYCEMIYALAVTVCEIPSGILADRFGRKKLLCFYYIFAAFELGMLLFAHGFWQFAIAIFFSGVGKALASGSENALLYDSLASAGRQADFEKQLGRISAIDLAGTLLAALSGGVLANFFRLELNYVVSIISTAAAFLLALTLKETPRLTAPESHPPGIRQTLQQASQVFRAKPVVLTYCLAGAVLGACMIYLDEFWQLLLKDIGLPVYLFGPVSALQMLAAIPGNLCAYKLKEKLPVQTIFICLILIHAGCLTALAFTQNALCLLPMLLAAFAAGVREPLVFGCLHHHTESAARATAESFYSLGLRAVSAGVGLLFGRICAASSIYAGFLLLGAVCLGDLLLFFYFMKRSSRPAQRSETIRSSDGTAGRSAIQRR